MASSNVLLAYVRMHSCFHHLDVRDAAAIALHFLRSLSHLKIRLHTTPSQTPGLTSNPLYYTITSKYPRNARRPTRRAQRLRRFEPATSCPLVVQVSDACDPTGRFPCRSYVYIRDSSAWISGKRDYFSTSSGSLVRDPNVCAD